MATAPPYMASVKNLPAILLRIREAGAPPRFSNEFLKNSLGFASSNDRGVIAVLKQLGFLTSDGAPTQRYNEFRADTAGAVLLLMDCERDGQTSFWRINALMKGQTLSSSRPSRP